MIIPEELVDWVSNPDRERRVNKIAKITVSPYSLWWSWSQYNSGANE